MKFLLLSLTLSSESGLRKLISQQLPDCTKVEQPVLDQNCQLPDCSTFITEQPVPGVNCVCCTEQNDAVCMSCLFGQTLQDYCNDNIADVNLMGCPTASLAIIGLGEQCHSGSVHPDFQEDAECMAPYVCEPEFPELIGGRSVCKEPASLAFLGLGEQCHSGSVHPDFQEDAECMAPYVCEPEFPELIGGRSVCKETASLAIVGLGEQCHSGPVHPDFQEEAECMAPYVCEREFPELIGGRSVCKENCSNRGCVGNDYCEVSSGTCNEPVCDVPCELNEICQYFDRRILSSGRQLSSPGWYCAPKIEIAVDNIQVSCGGHHANSCADCPIDENGVNHEGLWCNGECVWDGFSSCVNQIMHR